MTLRHHAPDAGDATPPIAGIIGDSPAMRDVFLKTRKVAGSNASVLLLGETGTGKELIAQAIHEASPRHSGPFVKVNCGALSESLLESELFGHVRGAYTGAIANRTGRFELAHTGTILLDEINSTSPMLQVKLLRVLQEREFERVGDTQTIRVDTRVIAATNRALTEEVEAQRFREDLYYRLDVLQIVLPPLRQRREDIPRLVAHFLHFYNEANDRYVVHIEDRAMQAMQDHDWPGNVRELQNCVENCVVMASGDELTYDLLPDKVASRAVGGRRVPSGDRMAELTYELVRHAVNGEFDDDRDLHHKTVRPLEKELIAQVMALCNHVQVKAAARLGINRNTLRSKLKEYGIDQSGEDPG